METGTEFTMRELAEGPLCPGLAAGGNPILFLAGFMGQGHYFRGRTVITMISIEQY